MKKYDFEYMSNFMAEQWKELKDGLKNENLNIDLDELKEKYQFFNHFDQVVDSTRYLYELELRESLLMMRGVKEKVDLSNYDRMIPKEKYAVKHNRMNPPGKAYMYIATIKKDKQRIEEIVRKHINTTIAKELRASDKDILTVCDLEVTKDGLDKKIFNVCGDMEIPKPNRELYKLLNQKISKCKTPVERKKVIEYIYSNLYFKMFISDYIFKPVDTNITEEKEYEYKPFQVLANYFENLGYVGIMYRSTVYATGTNIVLFKPELVKVKEGSMKWINWTNFKIQSTK